MARLVDAIDGNDFGQLDRYAHEMSTLGSSLGDARLTDLGHQLEDAAGTHEVEASRKLVVELREQVFRLATAAGIQSM
jgi:HPt (histidine-containing phosphotransfer) domain-containing protein